MSPEKLCPDCAGTGRCSDMACFCISDICHRCAGRGIIYAEPPSPAGAWLPGEQETQR